MARRPIAKAPRGAAKNRVAMRLATLTVTAKAAEAVREVRARAALPEIRALLAKSTESTVLVEPSPAKSGYAASASSGAGSQSVPCRSMASTIVSSLWAYAMFATRCSLPFARSGASPTMAAICLRFRVPSSGRRLRAGQR